MKGRPASQISNNSQISKQKKNVIPSHLIRIAVSKTNVFPF